MTPTEQDKELREQINKAISEAMGKLRPVVKPERGTGVMGVTSASDLLRIDVLDLITTHDQQLLEAILAGIVDVDDTRGDTQNGNNPKYWTRRTKAINERNEEIRQHIKSVFKKEGE